MAAKSIESVGVETPPSAPASVSNVSPSRPVNSLGVSSEYTRYLFYSFKSWYVKYKMSRRDAVRQIDSCCNWTVWGKLTRHVNVLHCSCVQLIILYRFYSVVSSNVIFDILKGNYYRLLLELPVLTKVLFYLIFFYFFLIFFCISFVYFSLRVIPFV